MERQHSATVLVTGAGGLLGRAAALRLLNAGYKPIGMDQHFPESSDLGFPIVQADINDTHRLYATMRKYAVASIIHCGAISGRVVEGDNPFMLLEINVRGTAQIFEAARHFKVERVVFCSSSAAYGNNVPDPLTEDAHLHPTTIYGASKACGEAILLGYAANYGIDGVALRIFNVYGPRRTTPCYVREMIVDALAGRETTIGHAKTSRRQYVYVDDVVDAIMLAWERRNLPHRAYNVAGDSSLSLEEVAERVASVVPGVRVRFAENGSAEQYRTRNVDLSLAKNELSYAPRVTLEDGIRRYMEWLGVMPC